MDNLKDLELEKAKIISEGETPSDEDHNERYNISKEELENYNERMKNISNLKEDEIKSVNGIKTKKRTTRQYNKIWSDFLKNHAQDFTKYMGYGVKEITKIGFKEFIDFMDWREPSDIGRYRYDRIKVIPCQHCKSHFTTFQLDMGLCNDCKKEFDLEKFGEVCAASEEKDPGSAGGLVVMFTYFEDFRNIYKKNIPFEDKVDMCVKHDDLRGLYTQEFIESIAGDEDLEDKFIEIARTIPMIQSTLNRFVSIRAIFESDDDREKKLERIKNIF